MAKYNEILVGRFARFLQKLTAIKGEVPASQLAGEIMPVFPLFTGVEHRYLESSDRYASSMFQAAVAAQTSQLRWRNPVGSNMIAVVEKLLMWESALDTPVIRLGALATDLGTISASNVRLDARSRPNATLIPSFTSAAGVSSVSVIMRPNVQANTSQELLFFEDHEITILPGDQLSIESGNVNVALMGNIFWRERFLEDSERA